MASKCTNLRSSLTYNTSETLMRHEQQECDTSDTLTTWARHECYTNDTSATRVKNFNFVTTRVKTYFHNLLFTIWQLKDYKERTNFILRTAFWKCIFSMRLKGAPQKLNFLMETWNIHSFKQVIQCCQYLH